jgi:hypothetical protein
LASSWAMSVRTLGESEVSNLGEKLARKRFWLIWLIGEIHYIFPQIEK